MADVHAGRHEQTDVSVKLVTWVAIGLIVAAIIMHVGLWLYERALNRVYPGPAPASRIAIPRSVAPAPRLQSNPAADWQELRRRDEAVLHGYGWVDRDAGTIRIPIERAIELTAERGLPARGADSVQPPAKPENPKGGAQ